VALADEGLMYYEVKVYRRGMPSGTLWDFDLDHEEFTHMGYILILNHFGGEIYANVGHFTKDDILITYRRMEA
jgi:hypothetical protein